MSSEPAVALAWPAHMQGSRDKAEERSVPCHEVLPV